MLRRLRNIFRPKPTAADPFIVQLARSELFFIAATESPGIDAKGLTSEALLTAIREALEQDKQNQQSGYGLFVYQTPSGERRLPLFSTSKHAETFCGEFSKERNRVFPFMVLQTRGTFLKTVQAGANQTVVLNDKCPDERVLSADELAAARRVWG